MPASPKKQRARTLDAAAQDEGDERSQDTMTGRSINAILARFRDLRLQPGAAFTEKDLVEELGVGKTPIREALLILGAQGYVIPRPRSGYRVSPITVRDNRHLMVVLRPLVAEVAAACAASDLDQTTLLLLDDLRLTMESGRPEDGRDVAAAMLHLITVMASSAGNSRLYRALAHLHHDFARVLLLVLREPRRRAIPPSASLIAAIGGGDEDGARRAAWDLMTQWEELITTSLLESDVLQSVHVALPTTASGANTRSRGGKAAAVARPAPARRPAEAPAKPASGTPAKKTGKATKAGRAAAGKAGAAGAAKAGRAAGAAGAAKAGAAGKKVAKTAKAGKAAATKKSAKPTRRR